MFACFLFIIFFAADFLLYLFVIFAAGFGRVGSSCRIALSHILNAEFFHCPLFVTPLISLTHRSLAFVVVVVVVVLVVVVVVVVVFVDLGFDVVCFYHFVFPASF